MDSIDLCFIRFAMLKEMGVAMWVGKMQVMNDASGETPGFAAVSPGSGA
jgi:hypothetical protein